MYGSYRLRRFFEDNRLAETISERTDRYRMAGTPLRQCVFTVETNIRNSKKLQISLPDFIINVSRHKRRKQQGQLKQ